MRPINGLQRLLEITEFMLKRFTFLFILFCSVSISKAQDIHFTSFDYAPLTINPSLAGAFLGTYRIGGIYRDQWRSVSSDGGFKTVNFHVDMPVIRGFREQDWIGIGVNVFNDRSNTYDINVTRSYQGFSYHLSLDKKQTQIISFGIQNSTSNTRILRNDRSFNTESFILSMDTSDDDLDLGGTSQMLTRWSGGAMYSQYLRNQMFIRGGLSVGNIGRLTNNNANLNTRLHYIAFAMVDVPLRGNLFITPQVLYQRKGNNQEFMTQAKIGFLLNEDKGIYVNSGLGVRWGDAVSILLGADYNDVRFQFAYDINVSGLSPATNTVGGFELGVSYIGKIYKKPKVDPTEVCPRF